MDTQQPTSKKCDVCKTILTLDEFGRLYCSKCNKNSAPKDLYEEAFFDLKDYKK